MLSLGSNIASLTTQRRLTLATQQLSQSYQRLSSGMRINRASDDAAGLAIADRLRTDTRLSSVASRNVNDALSMINIMDSAIEQQSQILVRLQELAEQSINGTITNAQRKTLNAEYSQLVREFGRLGDSTQFNGQSLLLGSRGGTASSIALQVGISNSEDSRIHLEKMDSGSLSGVIDRDLLDADLNRDGGLDGSDAAWLFVETHTKDELVAQFGGSIFFVSGSNGRGELAVITVQDSIMNRVEFFALHQQSDGSYLGGTEQRRQRSSSPVSKTQSGRRPRSRFSSVVNRE